MSDVVTDDIEGAASVLDAAAVRAFHDRLDGPVAGDDVLAELRACEELKNALAARQARLAVAVHENQSARDVPRGISPADTAREAGSQVALARRCAPHLGSRLLGLAHAVVEEMPHTGAALAAGVITEWDATVLCRETACLARDDRAEVDTAVAELFGTVSHQRLEAEAKNHAYRVDPAAVTARRARAETERRVTLRPAPDCMTRFSALLPVKDGIACFAALSAFADAAATPDHPRGHVMADTLVGRVTGRFPMGAKQPVDDADPSAASEPTVNNDDPSATAEPADGPGSPEGSGSPNAAGAPASPERSGAPTATASPNTTGQPDRSGPESAAADNPQPARSPRSWSPQSSPKPQIRINLLMPIDTLTGDVPAYLPGYGPIPADLAREWLTDPELAVQIRRIFAFPDTGDLVGMDSRARTYPGLLAEFIRLRDQTCRTPYCTAPIRHTDHIRPHAEGGPTSERNGDGLCEWCNYAKEHPDHHVTGHAGETTTTLGSLTATSRPPAPPGMPPPTTSYVERTLIDVMWAHHTTPPDQDGVA
ncbi:MAG TPA: DUF222 domain-containing protein [Flexivirga sp.]|uniref:DUF222 domain-containing protein n=1 Tax=Flexivirga sp. TaxID=1962927 RepID=UPI002CD229AF|nr:DUF222 domain-containing protein [Flexivirga sp.]HWC24708.1 DUF222 domain-containing protein [Flexivirga sp.]